MSTLKFEDKRGRTVTVTNIENNIAILNNGERVAVERLNDTTFYKPLNNNDATQPTNHITPLNESVNNNNNNIDINSTFNTDEIRHRNLQQNKSFSIGDDGDGVILHGVDRSRANQSSDIRMSGSVVETHNQNLISIGKEPIQEQQQQVTQPYTPTNKTKELELLNKYGHTAPTPPNTDPILEELAYGKKEIKDDINNTNQIDRYASPPPLPEVNPIHKMFDKAKKIHPLIVNLKFKEKIPNKDFIKMMEDSFDESAVDYYAKDIYLKLMKDPSVIENQVKEAIKKYLRSRTKK